MMKKKPTNGKNSWNFHLAKPMAGLCDITLEIHAEFWLDTLQRWFRGYRTPEGHKAAIWGKKADLHIAIAPLGTPTRTFPAIEEKTTRSKNPRLPPEQQAYVNRLQKKIRSLKKRLPPRVDEVLEQRCLDEINAGKIKTIIRECDTIWGDKGLSVEEKIGRLVPYKIEIYDLVSQFQLPDELVRADTNISILMATISYYTQCVEKTARKCKIKTPGQVRQLVKRVDGIITRMNEAQNRLNRIERDMTREKSETYDTYLDIKIGAKPAFRPFEKQLELYERLGEMPSLSTNTKIECLNEAVKLVRKQYGKTTESRCPHEPLVRKHLRAIGGYLNELGKEGETSWQLRMADKLLPTANAWREDGDLPALSKEALAAQIELQSVHIETREKEDGSIHYELELFFHDTDDTFAGHVLYAAIENGKVEEITLMG
ncbi:hypothetical protein OFAG_02233 [Oxalobacter formigenes HOxBLS]|uniref:DUF2262 domain-containing protein n=1 Tax=Oxalobacter paraformigenes TaxID=556268 RepID=T5LUN7_9BURK|nr:hypothetical protein OFAG_02233 [Oxalobacter paraformigenes]